MKIGPRARLALLALALGAGSAGLGPALAEQNTELKAGPGRDLTIGRCIICHSLEYIPANAPAENRAGWQKTIQKMRGFGAPITDAEAAEILDYLDAAYSGKS